MTGLVLQGPFLTRAQAARRSGLPLHVLPDRPDLLRIGSEFLEEVYFEFQFDNQGIRRDVGRVVQAMKSLTSDEAIADWLIRPNPGLNGTSPLIALNGSDSVDRVLSVVPTAPAEERDQEDRITHLVPTKDRLEAKYRATNRLRFTH